MITGLLVLIAIVLVMRSPVFGFLMILGVIHHCTTGDAEAATKATDLAPINEVRGGG